MRNGLIQQRDERHSKQPELESNERDVLALGILDANAQELDETPDRAKQTVVRTCRKAS